MNEQIQSLIFIVISYILIILIGYFLLNYLTNGFINKFLAVKISRGRKYLLEVHGIGEIYYRTGTINEELLTYKNREKTKKSLIVANDCVQYKAGLKTLSIDDVKNAVLKPDFSAVPGFDAVKLDNIIVRAMTNPTLQNNIIMIILIIAVITLLVSLGNAFTVYKLQGQISLLNQNLAMIVNSQQTII